MICPRAIAIRCRAFLEQQFRFATAAWPCQHDELRVQLAKLVYVPFKFRQHQQPLIPLRLLADGGQASGTQVPTARS